MKQETTRTIYMYGVMILAVLIMAGAIYFFAHEEPVEERFGATSISIDGETKDIEYTDDNTDEDLIIKSDTRDYMNWAGSITVHYSIFNNSKDDQNIKTSFSINGDIKHIWEYDGEDIIPAYNKKIPSPVSSSSDDITIKIPEEKITIWKELGLSDFTTKTIERKDTKDKPTDKEATVFIKSGETKFLKAEVRITGIEKEEEFYTEAFGDKGGYGHLQ